MSRRGRRTGAGQSATANTCESLGKYFDGQGEQAALLRHVVMPEHPWPSDDSPTLTYLLQRANEITQSDGAPAAMTWLAVHAWFEGALMDRSRSSGQSGALP